MGNVSRCFHIRMGQPVQSEICRVNSLYRLKARDSANNLKNPEMSMCPGESFKV